VERNSGIEGNGLDEGAGFAAIGVSGGDKGELNPALNGKYAGSGMTGLKTTPASGNVSAEDADGAEGRNGVWGIRNWP
jgi:hypothetical protein